MKKYELLLVLPGTLDEKEAEELSESFKQLVAEQATGAEKHVLGKNRLAYPVKQIRYGYFFTIVFESEPAEAKKLEAKLRLRREPLRALVSHFNTNLTTAQKIVYTTDDHGAVTMRERPTAPRVASAAEQVASLVAEAAPGAAPAQEPAAAVERPVEELDIATINKKLDDIMKGDILPGI